jgi:hypothetical protein
MSSIMSAPPALLAKVRNLGDFAVAGIVSRRAPSLEVHGLVRTKHQSSYQQRTRDLEHRAHLAPT